MGPMYKRVVNSGLRRVALAGLIGIAVVVTMAGCGSDKMADGTAAPEVSTETRSAPITQDTEGPGSPGDIAPSPTPLAFTPQVEPDPDYEKALDDVRFSTNYWSDTDFSRYTVPLGEFRSGGVRPDGIPSIDNPKFVTPNQANFRLDNEEPVMAFELDGDARAYPLQILIFHEIVNDVVAGVPMVITYCPLCNSAIAFERTLEGVVLDFGTTGNLRNSDLVMYDRQTSSWWQQFTGEAVVGTLAGRQLTFLSAPIISWQDFKDAYPNGKVLSHDTGYQREYGINPYIQYDLPNTDPFLFDGESDGRLRPKERVVAVTIGGSAAAFPFSTLEEEPVISHRVGGMEIVVFFQDGTKSALDSELISFSRDVGATGVFDPVLEGNRLSFRYQDGRIIDDQTGSAWNILGHAVEGELAGKMLTPVVHGNHFWFAWAAFNPETAIYPGGG